jgi:serine/threonine protein kinase/WD40 repeat protein
MNSPDDLLADLLARPDGEWRAGLEQICRQHPECEADLRRRFSRLEQTGVARPHESKTEGHPDVPEHFGPYRLLRRLGGGGMGVVWLAEHEALHREVAVKMIRPERLWFDNARERFQREVEAVARLRHHGCVQIHQVGDVGGVPYFAMEYVPGASCEQLATALRATARPPRELLGADLAAALRAQNVAVESGSSDLFAGSWVRVAVRIVLAAAEALAHAHARGVVHRDLKLGNLMVTPEGRVVVIDFGLALAEGASPLTREGAQLGSLPYMAPEQLRGETAVIGERTDVYALGVCLYELLALCGPFAARDEHRLRSEILAGNAVPLRTRNDAVAPDLAVVVARAMHVDGEHRYTSASHFAADLAAILQDRPVQARRDAVPARLKRWGRRHPALATAVLLSLLAVLVVPTAFSLAIAGQRDRALAAEQLSRRREYVANVAAASDALLAGNGDEARLRLEACAPEHRDFEWRHLALSLDDSLATVSIGSRPVVAVAVTPDGEWLAAGCDDGRVCIAAVDGSGRAREVAAADGTAITALGFDSLAAELFVVDATATLRVFDVATGERHRERAAAHPHEKLWLPNPVDCIVGDGGAARFQLLDRKTLAARPPVSVALQEGVWGRRYWIDGDEVVSSTARGAAIWSLRDGSMRASVGLPGPSVMFGASARLESILLEFEGRLVLWNRTSDVVVPVAIDLRGRQPLMAPFVDEARYIVVPCTNGEILVYDVPQARMVRTVQGHRGAVTAAAAVPRSASFVTGGEDGTVRRWDCRVLNGELELLGFGYGRALAIDERGHLLTGGEDSVLRATDADTGALLWRATCPHHVNGVAVVPGQDLVVSSFHERLQYWATSDGASRGELELPGCGWASRLLMLPEPGLLAVGGHLGQLALVANEPRRVQRQVDAHRGLIADLAWDAERARLWTCGHDGKLQWFAMGSDAMPVVVESIAGKFESIALAGDTLYTSEASASGRGGSLCERDAATGQVKRRRAVAEIATIVRVLGEQRLVVGTQHGHVAFWDRVAFASVLDQVRFAGAVRNLVVAPDGKWVAAIAATGAPLVLRADEVASGDGATGDGELVRQRVRIARARARAAEAMRCGWQPRAAWMLRADATLRTADQELAVALLPPPGNWLVGQAGRRYFTAPISPAAREAWRPQFEILVEALAALGDAPDPWTRCAYALAAVRMQEPAAALRALEPVQIDPELGPDDGWGMQLLDASFIRGLAHLQLGDRGAARAERDRLAALVSGAFAKEERAHLFLRELDEALR